MDGDDALEEVMLFGRDNGHYPTFDLFKAYYAIVDNYTKEVQYISDEIYVTDKYNLLVEDRNKDGISELYISYFKDGKFSVDEQGYNLRTTRCYDRIEWNPTGKNLNLPEMKTRLTLILVLLIYIGAASHTHATAKESNQKP